MRRLERLGKFYKKKTNESLIKKQDREIKKTKLKFTKPVTCYPHPSVHLQDIC